MSDLAQETSAAASATSAAQATMIFAARVSS